jgi:hypothetical protein
MSGNSTKDYNDFTRANLPAGMTYNGDVDRYQINDHSFFTYNKSDWYYRYISKFGYLPYGVAGFTPPYVLDYIDRKYIANDVVVPLSSATTFARSGSATMFNSTGTLVTIADGVPRENSYLYEGGAWVNNGLQLESEARTNLLSYSQDYTNGVWLKGANVTVSGNTDISPDGSQNADRLYEAATTASHALVSEVVSFSPGNSHTASIYAKNVPGGRGLLQIAFFQALSGNVTTYANFDLINGVVTVESGCTATMEDVGNGFYRCRLTFVQGGRTSERVNLVLINSTTAGTFQSYAGDTSKAIILGGSQFEIASTPSSYIPTSGSTVTRAAETLTASAANLPWGSSVSLQISGKMNGANSTFVNWTLDANNNILMQSGASDFTFTQEAGGVVDTVTGGSFTSGINTPFNLASRHGSTFVNGAIDGTALTANTTPVSLPDLENTDLQIAQTFMGHVHLVRVWAVDIGDTGIGVAST